MAHQKVVKLAVERAKYSDLEYNFILSNSARWVSLYPYFNDISLVSFSGKDWRAIQFENQSIKEILTIPYSNPTACFLDLVDQVNGKKETPKGLVVDHILLFDYQLQLSIDNIKEFFGIFKYDFNNQDMNAIISALVKLKPDLLKVLDYFSNSKEALEVPKNPRLTIEEVRSELNHISSRWYQSQRISWMLSLIN